MSAKIPDQKNPKDKKGRKEQTKGDEKIPAKRKHDRKDDKTLTTKKIYEEHIKAVVSRFARLRQRHLEVRIFREVAAGIRLQ
jgi:hypothetical protein